MTPVELSNPVYSNEDAARAHLEAIRWPGAEVICPHCGSTEGARALGGESMGKGWYYCEDCQDKFTVRTGTVYERSHVPLHKWLLAFRLMASSKKGMSAHQLHRTLGVTYKTAWFMAHRIREAMGPGSAKPGPMGGEGKFVEADTTYIGGKEYNKHLGKRTAGNIGGMGKQIVHAIVERDGRVRAHHIPRVNGVTLRAGSDNIRDLWSPFGNGCMIERAMLIALRQGFRTDADLALAYDLGCDSRRLAPGTPADFIAIAAETRAEAITERPARLVFRAGNLIARDGMYLG